MRVHIRIFLYYITVLDLSNNIRHLQRRNPMISDQSIERENYFPLYMIFPRQNWWLCHSRLSTTKPIYHFLCIVSKNGAAVELRFTDVTICNALPYSLMNIQVTECARRPAS